MKAIRLGELASTSFANAEVQDEIEAQIKDLVLRDSIITRKPRADIPERHQPDASLLIARISTACSEMIEQAINHLENMKAALLDQQEKVRREMRALEVANEDASGALKIVAEMLAKCKENSVIALGAGATSTVGTVPIDSVAGLGFA